MVNNHCCECYWSHAAEYDETGVSVYLCRRYPPTPRKGTWFHPKPTKYDPAPRPVHIEVLDQYERWPVVGAYEGCGEFKRGLDGPPG